MFQARAELIKHSGPPQGDRNVCCHNCPNDSMARNGFVCCNPHHLYWGTYSENVLDQGEAMSARQPDNANKLQVVCPHCGKTGQKRAMARWHFDNCRHQ
jgi:hypothetical protein